MHMLREMDDWMTNFVVAAQPSHSTSEDTTATLPAATSAEPSKL